MRYLLIIFLLNLSGTSFAQQQPLKVEFNETYELANVILALTEYGKADPYEVLKGTGYYREVMNYFAPYTKHPLLEKVNYSREKWDYLLSFRTDAYAFTFTKDNRLIRSFKFYAMDKKMHEFDDHLKLVEDFAVKSNFREFYRLHQPFYDSIATLYEQSLMIPEIVSFLNTEFEMKPKLAYAIVVSPLVGRMHCQRHINGVSVSFIAVADYLYEAKRVEDISRKDIATELHMFFTEIDHDYVNPSTEQYEKIYTQCFKPEMWDSTSGYGEYRFAIYNEYMTWAVYDIFIYNYFPEVADEPIRIWHNIAIDNGFFASDKFAAKLYDLYKQRKPGETIKDLYPALLEWCRTVQGTLH